MSRSFADVLRECSGGRTIADLSDGLTELVAAVQQTRASGSITLTLTVKPNGDNSVLITEKTSIKAPQLKRGESVFFVQGGGDLVRSDPRQQNLPCAKSARRK
jgi:hypothetical protein